MRFYPEKTFEPQRSNKKNFSEAFLKIWWHTPPENFENKVVKIDENCFSWHEAVRFYFFSGHKP